MNHSYRTKEVLKLVVFIFRVSKLGVIQFGVKRSKILLHAWCLIIFIVISILPKGGMIK